MKPWIWTPAVVVATFVTLFALERSFPLRPTRRSLAGRLAINLALSGLAFAVAGLVVRPWALRSLDWASGKPFGLLYFVHIPAWAKAVSGFLLLDLSFYYWHVVNHKIPVLWRFHNVHHIDPELDVSTGFRFHFGEVLLSTVFRVAQVSLFGISFATFATYELVFQVETLFQHSNLHLPIRLERALNRVLVTPRMHGIHHSQVRQEDLSNFGVVFSWWDWLHRTLGLNIAQARIEIGIPGYSSPEDNRLSFILPFMKQRDYWRRPDGSVPARPPNGMEKHPSRLAE